MTTTAHSIVGYRPEGRPKDDFYPTPESATLALLNNANILPGSILEPACGDGAISKVLIDHGREVYSCDLYNHGFGLTGIDFFTMKYSKAKIMVTNPPFNLSEEFLSHALEIGMEQIFMLLKLAFLEGDRRSKLLESTPLKNVYVFRKRLTMTRNGEKLKNGGMIAFAWYEWLAGYEGRPEVRWI